jgi:hypothetical protein
VTLFWSSRPVRRVRSERALPLMSAALGPGWKALVDELNRRLWCMRPSAAVRATLGMDGLLRLTVYDPAARAEVDALCDQALARAVGLCEPCGQTGTLRSGVVITVRCARCSNVYRKEV